MFFARLLRIKGFDVTMKTNLKAGLSYFKNKTCHVLFIDVPLVEYDNKQILHLLEENHLFQKSNIFLFSSIDLDTDELNEWKKHGLYSYLKKPVNRDVILNALNDVYAKITHTTYKNTVEFHADDDNRDTNDDDKEPSSEQIQKVNQLQQKVEQLENMQQKVEQLENMQQLAASSAQQHSPQEEQSAPTSEPSSEQIQKVNQLQQKVEQLENMQQLAAASAQQHSPQEEQSAPTSEPSSEQIQKVNQLQQKVEQLENMQQLAAASAQQHSPQEEQSAPTSEPSSEQIQKVNQLQQKVEQLENMQQLAAASAQQHSPQEEQSAPTSEPSSETTTVKKSSKDHYMLQNVINNLRSLPSKHNSDEYLPKSPIGINSHEQGIIKKELEQAASTSETTTVKKSSKDHYMLQNVINNLRSLPSKHNSDEYLPKSPIGINSHEQGIIKKELEQAASTSETTTVKKSSKDHYMLQNVINNLRSLPSKHNSDEYLPKSPTLVIQK